MTEKTLIEILLERRKELGEKIDILETLPDTESKIEELRNERKRINKALYKAEPYLFKHNNGQRDIIF